MNDRVKSGLEQYTKDARIAVNERRHLDARQAILTLSLYLEGVSDACGVSLNELRDQLQTINHLYQDLVTTK